MNLYEILGLPLFSDFDTIKKRYYQLAKSYHPDITNDPEHAEYFKIITNIYNQLSLPDFKSQYDSELISNSLNLNLKENKLNNKEERIARAQKIKQEQIQNRISEIIEKFELKKTKNTLKLQKLTGILLFIYGFSHCSNHWFIDYRTNDLFHVIIGFFVFASGAVLISYLYYEKLQYTQAKFNNLMTESKKAILFYISLLFGTPIIFILYMKMVAWFHFSNYANYTLPSHISFDNDKIYYGFVINGIEYLKITDFDASVPINKNKLRVKYSMANPNICELINIETPSVKN